MSGKNGWVALNSRLVTETSLIWAAIVIERPQVGLEAQPTYVVLPFGCRLLPARPVRLQQGIAHLFFKTVSLPDLKEKPLDRPQLPAFPKFLKVSLHQHWILGQDIHLIHSGKFGHDHFQSILPAFD